MTFVVGVIVIAIVAVGIAFACVAAYLAIFAIAAALGERHRRRQARRRS